MSDIETTNKFLVSLTGDDRIVFLRPVPASINAEDALLLAAWLVAISGKSEEEFQAVYDAVCRT